MKTITMEIRKRSLDGELVVRSVDLTELADTLTPAEIFSMEFKINEIPSLRAHISLNEEPEDVYYKRTSRL